MNQQRGRFDLGGFARGASASIEEVCLFDIRFCMIPKAISPGWELYRTMLAVVAEGSL
jgi:hypothetical protein